MQSGHGAMWDQAELQERRLGASPLSQPVIGSSGQCGIYMARGKERGEEGVGHRKDSPGDPRLPQPLLLRTWLGAAASALSVHSLQEGAPALHPALLRDQVSSGLGGRRLPSRVSGPSLELGRGVAHPGEPRHGAEEGCRLRSHPCGSLGLLPALLAPGPL